MANYWNLAYPYGNPPMSNFDYALGGIRCALLITNAAVLIESVAESIRTDSETDVRILEKMKLFPTSEEASGALKERYDRISAWCSFEEKKIMDQMILEKIRSFITNPNNAQTDDFIPTR